MALSFAGVLQIDLPFAAGSLDNIGLVRFAVVIEQGLGVDDRPGGSLGKAFVDTEVALVGDAQHLVAQGVGPLRAHGLGRHDVGEQQADVDGLGAQRGEPPGEDGAGGDVDGDGEFDVVGVVRCRVVGQDVERRGVEHDDLAGPVSDDVAEGPVGLACVRDPLVSRVGGAAVQQEFDHAAERVRFGQRDGARAVVCVESVLAAALEAGGDAGGAVEALDGGLFTDRGDHPFVDVAQRVLQPGLAAVDQPPQALLLPRPKHLPDTALGQAQLAGLGHDALGQR